MTRPDSCVCCQAVSAGQDPRLAWRTQIRQHIARYGWSVQQITKDPPPHMMYTVGLTETGLPELLVPHVPPAQAELAHRVINAFGRSATRKPFVIGERRRLANFTAVVSAFDGREHLGGVELLYGDRFHVLTVEIPELLG